MNIQKLHQIANELRIAALEMINKAKAGHPGGTLSAADIVTSLYFHEMNLRPDESNWLDRDRFIMSKGHACPILYAALAHRGYFDKSHLDTLRKYGSILQGHPDMRKTPGLDATSGSLGQGLSIGLGMALMGKLDKRTYRVFVLLGCGELNEGQVWEAALCANKYKLGNLVAIVDYNKLQLDGANDEIMPLEPLEDKWRAFGWSVCRIDGNNIEQILKAFANLDPDVPNIIIAETVKGKGVSFMENQLNWHGKAPSNEELQAALRELESK
jgi:transketolase